MKRLCCRQIVLAAVVALVVLVVPVLAQRSRSRSLTGGTIRRVWKPVRGGGPKSRRSKSGPRSRNCQHRPLSPSVWTRRLLTQASRHRRARAEPRSEGCERPVAFRIEDDAPHPGGFHTIVTGEPNGRSSFLSPFRIAPSRGATGWWSAVRSTGQFRRSEWRRIGLPRTSRGPDERDQSRALGSQRSRPWIVRRDDVR